MRLEELELSNFRNYLSSRRRFSPGRNFLFGRNAQGKSNLLEAIALLALTKSFRGASDEELVGFQGDRFTVSGTLVNERHQPVTAAISYERHGRKQIAYHGKRLQRHADLVGKLPIVVFSPESHRITSGPPAERRRFMDVLLSQGSPAYLADLQEYSRVLRQRNAILGARRTPGADEELAAWDESLAESGARIVNSRAAFFIEVANAITGIYRRVDSAGGALRLRYHGAVEPGDQARQALRDLLQHKRAVDWLRAQTTKGPHRDDVDIMIGDCSLRAYGSRGEHKSVLIALKLMETEYLRQRRDTAPMVIMDDLFSELDPQRAVCCLELFSEQGQLFVSSVTAPSVQSQPDDLVLEIDNGNFGTAGEPS